MTEVSKVVVSMNVNGIELQDWEFFFRNPGMPRAGCSVAGVPPSYSLLHGFDSNFKAPEHHP